MFSIEGYFKSLKNQFTSSELETSVDFDIGETEGRVLPMYERAADLNLETHTNRAIAGAFNSHYKHKNTISVYDAIFDTLSEVVENKDDIIKMVKSEFNKENPKEIMDYYKINLLKYLESIHFLNEYASKWINVIVVEALEDRQFLNLPDIKVSKEFILDRNNIALIAQVCNNLNQPVADFIKEIIKLKGYTYAEADWRNKPEETQKNVDAFKSGLIPVRWNPLYHLGIMIATWQAENDEKYKAEYERMQFLLLQLKDKQENTGDPKIKEHLDKQIHYYSDQINKRQMHIEKLNERYS